MEIEAVPPDKHRYRYVRTTCKLTHRLHPPPKTLPTYTSVVIRVGPGSPHPWYCRNLVVGFMNFKMKITKYSAHRNEPLLSQLEIPYTTRQTVILFNFNADCRRDVAEREDEDWQLLAVM